MVLVWLFARDEDAAANENQRHSVVRETKLSQAQTVCAVANSPTAEWEPNISSEARRSRAQRAE
jgi:hypothetical protein